MQAAAVAAARKLGLRSLGRSTCDTWCRSSAAWMGLSASELSFRSMGSTAGSSTPTALAAADRLMYTAWPWPLLDASAPPPCACCSSRTMTLARPSTTSGPPAAGRPAPPAAAAVALLPLLPSPPLQSMWPSTCTRQCAASTSAESSESHSNGLVRASSSAPSCAASPLRATSAAVLAAWSITSALSACSTDASTRLEGWVRPGAPRWSARAASAPASARADCARGL
mmetsp:Transcript_8373/g.20849  ORF Transcript_8373/g.20849 Transcript_8373/m.20849 type:complete len:227 (-) Transcript_8373:877-1557(-)